MNSRRIPIRLLGVLAFAAVSASSAAAQRILDWPVRVSAGAESTVRGAAAVFWNPANLRTEGTWIDALVVDLRAPGDIGLRGLAVAATYEAERTVFGLGYHHNGIDGIPFTEGPPIETEVNEVSVGEDEFLLAAAHQVRPALAIGATARYVRADYAGSEEDAIRLGAGVDFMPPLGIEARFSGFVLSETERFNWSLGTEVTLPSWLGQDYRLMASYGARGGESEPGTLHRAGASVRWRDLAEVGAAAVREPDGDGSSWQPALAASLHLNRYTVGVVREQLPHGFGGSWAIRFQMGLSR